MYDSIIILGPTATGKTSIAISLAKALNTEIINADSMYIYKRLDIGTAKPNEAEMNGVVHHLIDIVEPENSFNVAEYRELAKEKLKYFKKNNLFPIIVGGTGFYIDSLIKNYSYGDAQKDENLRNELINTAKEFGNEFLYNRLKELDSASALKIDKNDLKRIIRAIEICTLSGNKKSEIINNENPLLSNPLIIGLNIDRDILYPRINSRVDQMVNNGLIDEVKNLYNSGLTPENNQSMKGIGYKEIVDYLRGDLSLNEAIDKIKQHTRNYAKRQITWFKRNEKINWINPLEIKNDDIVNLILKIKNS